MQKAFVYTSLGLRRCVCGCCFCCLEELIKKYFTKADLTLWGASVRLILLSFLIFDRVNYMTFRRSPYFALAYAANDIVLIVLWIFASMADISYLSVMICFVLFLVNDIYGYISWRKMEQRQMA